jgi:hypothetical protein
MRKSYLDNQNEPHLYCEYLVSDESIKLFEADGYHRIPGSNYWINEKYRPESFGPRL